MKLGATVFEGKSKKGRVILIRLPVKDDIPALRNYINEISKEQTFITFQGEQLSLKEERKVINTKLKKIIKNEAIMLIVFHDNKIVGVGDVTMQERTSSHVGIFGITIAKNFRNEGIGTLLMRLVLNEAEKNIRELRIVTLGVFECNDLAFKMYKKFGFIEYGRLPEGIQYKNSCVGHVLMYKKFSALRVVNNRN